MFTKLEENNGGQVKLDIESSHFKDFIQNNWVIDLPFNNGMYTQNNTRSGSQQISSRLDHFLLSDNVINLRGDFTSSILPLSRSNHWPISLQWQRPGNSTRRPLCFEAFWLTHLEFNNLVLPVWKSFIPPEGTKNVSISTAAQISQNAHQAVESNDLWKYLSSPKSSSTRNDGPSAENN